ncbi:MAG: hypothetical protein K5686_04315 [Lachnospiraceae bacterium]|nr:hypothetical protein [Lachnospiraceae bacterium]
MPAAKKKPNNPDIKLPLKQLLEKEKQIVKAAEKLDSYLATLESGMMDRIMTDESTPEVNAARKEVSRLLDNVMNLQEEMTKETASFKEASTEVRRKISFEELSRQEKKAAAKHSLKQDKLKELAAADVKSGPVLEDGEGVLLPKDRQKQRSVKRREKNLEKNGPSI